MLRFFKNSLLLVLLFTVFSCTEENPKQDIPEKEKQIVDAYIKAIGGKDRIAKVKTYQTMGTWENGSTQRYAVQVPSKFYIKLYADDLTEVSIYNSGRFQLNTNGKKMETMEDAYIKEFQLDAKLFPLAYLSELVTSVKLIGEKTIDNKVNDELEILFNNGVKWIVCFDKNTHLISTINRGMGMLISYKDYRKVNGITSAFTYEYEVPKKEKMILKLDLVEFNVDLPLDLFVIE